MKLADLGRVSDLATARKDLARALELAQSGAFDVRVSTKVIRDAALTEAIREDVVAAIRRELLEVDYELHIRGVELS